MNGLLALDALIRGFSPLAVAVCLLLVVAGPARAEGPWASRETARTRLIVVVDTVDNGRTLPAGLHVVLTDDGKTHWLSPDENRERIFGKLVNSCAADREKATAKLPIGSGLDAVTMPETAFAAAVAHYGTLPGLPPPGRIIVIQMTAFRLLSS